MGAELLDAFCLQEQQGRRSGVAGIADGKADDLGWESPGRAEIEEVLVLGDQYQALLTGPCPDRGVNGAPQADQAHMGGVREPFNQERQQLLREVFIQQQLRWIHADGLTPQLGW